MLAEEKTSKAAAYEHGSLSDGGEQWRQRHDAIVMKQHILW